MAKIIISILIFAATGLIVYYFEAIRAGINSKITGYKDSINTLIVKSVADIRKNEIVRIELAVALLSIALFMLTNEFLAVLAAVPVMVLMPGYYIKYRQRRYTMEYYSDIVGFLESVTSGLKAGMSIVKAFQTVAERDHGPVGSEMAIVLKKVELGKSMQEALQELAEKIPLKENEIIISALNTAMETGGNITDVLENILDTIRKRDELNREVKALTSQGILSGIIVGLLPVFLIAAVSFIDPQFMEPLFTTPTGKMLLCAAVVMELTGAFAIRSIINVK
jgi:tight adherence protein B